jgi:serine phosphatase RsbU (regulator of sigma subunit)/anti-sigma regulatory factor (Ser/Thr protein kinase)
MKKATRQSARSAAGAAANTSRYSSDDDLELCRQIQRAMIPRALPRVTGVEMQSLYLPSRAIGGDLFDVLQVSEDLLGMYIFDIARCGFSSALISAMAKAGFSKFIRESASPRAVLERVNAEMIEQLTSRFYLTAFVAYLDLHNNMLTFCNAGHPCPLVYRKKAASLEPLHSDGALLGVFDDAEFEEESRYLYPGDWILLFTDGVYSALDRKDVMAGKRRLEHSMRASKGRAAAVLDTICRKANATAQPLEDDVTAIVVEILTQSRKNQIKEKLGFDRNDPVYLQYISYYEEMDRAAAAILRAMDMAGFVDESIRKMKITLTELLANAIGHGNRENHAKKVTIGHMVNKREAAVAVMDQGAGFDPSSIPDPTLPENLAKDHGRGLYIVRNYVDELTYNESANRILIRKRNA